jgi:hypothetical protein
MIQVSGPGLTILKLGPMVGSCEYINELSRSTESREFLD